MSATVRLYDLAQAREILDEFLSETEGEVTPELEQLLADLDGQADEKIERVALYIREQRATAAAVREEEQRLAARRKSLERAADGLTRYLETNLRTLGKTKVTGLLATVALQQNPPRLVGDLDEHRLGALLQEVPGVVRVIPQRLELDRRAALDAIKAGAEIDGLSLERGESLRIR